MRSGFARDALGDDLLAREELHGIRAVGVQVAVDRVLPAGEREPGDGRRYTDVHAEHSRLRLEAVTAHGRGRVGEDRPGVPVARPVQELDRLPEVAGAD